LTEENFNFLYNNNNNNNNDNNNVTYPRSSVLCPQLLFHDFRIRDIITSRRWQTIRVSRVSVAAIL